MKKRLLLTTRCSRARREENKAEAVAGAVEGPIPASNPASILQMHPTAQLYLDEKSASKLARRDYYRWVFDNKSGWQRD
jgi:glucosamine-6-phosphate deaminase